jgi:hypothetical protein
MTFPQLLELGGPPEDLFYLALDLLGYALAGHLVFETHADFLL